MYPRPPEPPLPNEKTNICVTSFGGHTEATQQLAKWQQHVKNSPREFISRSIWIYIKQQNPLTSHQSLPLCSQGQSWCDTNSMYKCVRELHCEQSAQTHQGWPRWQHAHFFQNIKSNTRVTVIKLMGETLMGETLTRFRQLIEDLLYVSNSNSHILVLQHLLTVINGVLLKCKNCNKVF